MSRTIKGQRLGIFIFAIKKGTIREGGREEGGCKDRLRKEGMMVGREEKKWRRNVSTCYGYMCCQRGEAKRMMKYDSPPPPKLVLISPLINKKDNDPS